MTPPEFHFLRAFVLLMLATACALPHTLFARSLSEAGEASEWKFLTDTNAPASVKLAP